MPRSCHTTRSDVSGPSWPREWRLWQKPEDEGGGLTTARAYRHGPPAYVVRAWTWRQAFWMGYNADSQTSSARTDGLGVWSGTALR